MALAPGPICKPPPQDTHNQSYMENHALVFNSPLVTLFHMVTTWQHIGEFSNILFPDIFCAIILEKSSDIFLTIAWFSFVLVPSTSDILEPISSPFANLSVLSSKYISNHITPHSFPFLLHLPKSISSSTWINAIVILLFLHSSHTGQ